MEEVVGVTTAQLSKRLWRRLVARVWILPTTATASSVHTPSSSNGAPNITAYTSTTPLPRILVGTRFRPLILTPPMDPSAVTHSICDAERVKGSGIHAGKDAFQSRPAQRSRVTKPAGFTFWLRSPRRRPALSLLTHGSKLYPI